MKQVTQKLFKILVSCALLAGFANQTSSATLPLATAFSVLVTESDGRTGIAGATVQVGRVSKTTNGNGFAALNMYFDNGDQAGTVSKDGYASVKITVGAKSEGQTIQVKLARQ